METKHAHSAQQLAIVALRRVGFPRHPVEQISVVFLEQLLERPKFARRHLRQMSLGEGTDQQVGFFRAAVPAAKQQALRRISSVSSMPAELSR